MISSAPGRPQPDDVDAAAPVTGAQPRSSRCARRAGRAGRRRAGRPPVRRDRGRAGPASRRSWGRRYRVGGVGGGTIRALGPRAVLRVDVDRERAWRSARSSADDALRGWRVVSSSAWRISEVDLGDRDERPAGDLEDLPVARLGLDSGVTGLPTVTEVTCRDWQDLRTRGSRSPAGRRRPPSWCRSTSTWPATRTTPRPFSLVVDRCRPWPGRPRR